jgi:hypothetical protein
MATIINGDIFTCPQGVNQLLVHQCNCVTSRAAHLSWQVFRRYPDANIYAPRAHGVPNSIPGTIVVIPPIINVLGQYAPGKSRQQNDTFPMRFEWFQQCLNEIGTIADLEMLSFPWGIGCGAAGGNWVNYHAAIDAWATAHPQFEVRIYKLHKQPSTDIRTWLTEKNRKMM